MGLVGSYMIDGGGTAAISTLRWNPTLAQIKTALIRTIAGFIAFLVLGNVTILSLHMWAASATETITVPALEGMDNLRAVDAHLWRGAKPTDEGYRELAANGVTTVVDLRAEEGIEINEALLARLGITRISLPMRDGQAPSDDQVTRFLNIVASSEGRVYVHCGAGVGRTGTMAAAYLVTTGQASAAEALQRNLSVGPPSLEQVSFVTGLSDEDGFSAGGVLTAVSRVLDAPRRIWVRVRGVYSH